MQINLKTKSMDKGKIIQLLKGYSTDSKDKLETSIDYDRINDLADDLIDLIDLEVVRVSFNNFNKLIEQFEAETKMIWFRSPNSFKKYVNEQSRTCK